VGWDRTVSGLANGDRSVTISAVAGLGERRRAYHRGAVADKLRELRRENGWSQEDLADRLGVDRRQVVRLETRRAPVTLEVVEALARAFGVLSIVFMFSVSEDNALGPHFDSDWVHRVAEAEFRNLFGAAVERPGVSWLIHTAMSLPDEDLDLVGHVADAFLRAGQASDSPGEYSFVARSIFARSQESLPKRRSTRSVVRPPAGRGPVGESESRNPGHSKTTIARTKPRASGA